MNVYLHECLRQKVTFKKEWHSAQARLYSSIATSILYIFQKYTD
jgi:hypothetical protein